MVQLIFQVCTTIKLQNFTEKVGHANQSFDDKLIKQQIFILLQCGHQLCHFLLIFACLECVVMTNVCLLTILKQEPFSTCSSFIVLVSRFKFLRRRNSVSSTITT